MILLLRRLPVSPRVATTGGMAVMKQRLMDGKFMSFNSVVHARQEAIRYYHMVLQEETTDAKPSNTLLTACVAVLSRHVHLFGPWE